MNSCSWAKGDLQCPVWHFPLKPRHNAKMLGFAHLFRDDHFALFCSTQPVYGPPSSLSDWGTKEYPGDAIHPIPLPENVPSPRAGVTLNLGGFA